VELQVVSQSELQAVEGGMIRQQIEEPMPTPDSGHGAGMSNWFVYLNLYGLGIRHHA
jgi:hypothetical protein